MRHCPATALMSRTAPLFTASLPASFLAMFLSALEQTIVAPALPAIGKSLADVDDLSWVVTAYLLAATAATPLSGKLSDIHGPQRSFFWPSGYSFLARSRVR